MKLLTRAQHMGAAALIMAVSVFLSRFMGLIRDKVISYYHGTGAEADIYFASFVIPDFINYLLAGGYFSITLIPLLSRFFAEDEEDGWRFFSAAFYWVSLAIIGVTVLAWMLAPQLAHLAAPGFEAAKSARLAHFLRIVLPAQACFLPGACLTALLYLRKQFVIPALTPLIYNGCIIAGGMIFYKLNPQSGMEGFCWGVLCGAALGSLILPLIAARAGGLRLSFTLRHRGLKRFILLALPLMLGQSIVVLDEQFLRVFGSLGGEGAVSLLNYARRIMLVPVGVVAQAAGVAAYPFLASLAAKEDWENFNSTVRRALLAGLGVILPLSLWMMSAAEPTMRLIFQQGSFSARDTAVSAALLVIMLCGTAFWAVQQILGRGFYARENTITPVLTGSLATLLTLPLFWGLSRLWGVYGVALASLSGLALYTLFLMQRWRTHCGGAALHGTGRATLLIIGVSLPPAVLSFFATRAISLALPGRVLLAAALALAASGPLFAVLYFMLARKIAPTLLQDLPERLKKRLKISR